MEEPGSDGCINAPSGPVIASQARAIRMESPGLGLSQSGTGRRQLGRLRDAWNGLMKGTVFSSIFTLLTTCIGAGTLSLPYAFDQGGLITTSVIFLLIMVVSVIVGFLLFSAKRYCQELYPGMAVWGYEDLALASFGAIGKIIVLLTLILLLFLSLIAYMIYTRDQLDLIVQFALTHTGHIPTCTALVNCAVLMSIAFIPIFPITLLKDLTPMQITSTLSILCIGYVGIAMFIRMITFQHRDHNDHNINYVPQAFKGVVTAITYCSLSFVCHFNLLPLQKELHRPTKTRLNIIVIGSMILAYTLYNLVIFSGFFTFYDDLKEDVMLNYSRDDILITTARVALFFTLLFSYPVLLHPTRAAINRLLVYMYNLSAASLAERGRRRRRGKINDEYEEVEKKRESVEEEDEPLLPKAANITSDAKIPMSVWVSETWVLFAATFLPASFIPNVGLVWNFVGSIGGTLVLYIFPAAFFLRLRYMRYVRRRKIRGTSIRSQYNWYAVIREVVATIILVTGFLLLIAENYSAIEAITERDTSPNSLCYQAKCGSIAISNTTSNSSSFSGSLSEFHW